MSLNNDSKVTMSWSDFLKGICESLSDPALAKFANGYIGLKPKTDNGEENNNGKTC